MTASPFIVRIAGLPGQTLAAFSGTACRQALTQTAELEARITQARGLLAESLFQIARSAPPPARRLAIEMKRACFNSRQITPWIDADGWQHIAAQLDSQVDHVLDLELQLNAASDALDAAYEQERKLESRALSHCVSNPRLLRGIALASPTLVDEWERLQGNPCSNDRKTRRVERSLLRYISRATVKLSPFSTLTSIGIGIAESERAGDTVSSVAETREETSLFRIKRSVVDQFLQVLIHRPEVRDRLVLKPNNTIEPLGDGGYRLYRSFAVVRDLTTGSLRVEPASQVTLKLRHPLIGWLTSTLLAQEYSFGEAKSKLGARLQEEPGTDVESAAKAAEKLLESLITTGFLELIPPWPSYELRLEKRLHEFLRTLPASPALARISGLLQSLVSRGDTYPHVAQPHRSVQEMNRLTLGVWDEIALDEPALELSLPPSAVGYFEDVVLSGEAPSGALVSVDKRTVADLLRCGNTIWKVFHLYNPRFNFLHTLAGLLKARWPHQESVPFLELFAVARPFWREFVALRRQHKAEEYNPSLLAEVAELFSARAAVAKSLKTISSDGPDFEIELFEAVAARIPDHYDPVAGSCIFTQPAAPTGGTWALNRLFEGTGKHSARFVAGLEEPVRSRLLDTLQRNSIFHVNGQRIELLDVLYGHENTVNLHLPQTPKLLELPGEYFFLPEERKLTLQDLNVTLDPASGLVALADRSGTRYLPCFLSAVAEIYMPVLVKFLSMFGPAGYLPSILPGWCSRERERVLILERLTIGKLVFRRKRWLVPRDMLPSLSLPETSYFRAINYLASDVGIPAEVFWIEPVAGNTNQERYKPQYISLSSPSFVAMLQHRLANTTSSYATFEEALPCPGHFPQRVDDRRVALELILDDILLRDV